MTGFKKFLECVRRRLVINEKWRRLSGGEVVCVRLVWCGVCGCTVSRVEGKEGLSQVMHYLWSSPDFTANAAL